MSNNIILDPTAPSGAGAQRPWKALDTLKGKTVAFIDNSKPNFNHLAQDLGDLLVEHHGVAKVIHHRKRAASVPALESVYADIEANVDLVITGSGDWGSCTSWSVHDTAESTKRGVPAITICSDQFIVLGRKQLKALGSEGHPIAVIPHPFGLRTREQVRAIAETCIADIARIAVDPKAGALPGGKISGAPARAARIEVPEDADDFDRFCIERKWSDGLPLRPPTLEKVERMIAASGRAADDVVAIVQPGFGSATVEGIAINAVMAGCRPEYIRTLIAAVEAFTDRRFNLQGIQATTNPATAMIIVNGPVAREIGVNGHLNCLGQGTWANATLGRALRLIMQNIGGTLPGEMDRATQGQPGKYTFCCAENEADSPWEPLHVERGFDKDDSTVTLIGAAGTVNFNSHAKDAADLLKVIADSICFPTNNDYYFGGEPWLLLGPEHAEILAREGLSKRDVKLKLWEMSKLHVDRLAAKDRMRLQHTRGAELGQFGTDTKIPISIKPEEVSIVCAGGPGTHSVHVPTFGHTRSVTRKIV